MGPSDHRLGIRVEGPLHFYEIEGIAKFVLESRLLEITFRDGLASTSRYTLVSQDGGQDGDHGWFRFNDKVKTINDDPFKRVKR